MVRSFPRLAVFLLAALSCSAAMAEVATKFERSLDSTALHEGLYAKPQRDDWNYALRLNGWLPSLNGAVGVEGVKTDVDLSISEILDHLNITCQTSFAARRGRWGFAADLFYVKLSGGTAKVTTSLISNLGLDIKETFG